MQKAQGNTWILLRLVMTLLLVEGAALLAQSTSQEQRITEQRTMTDASGRVMRTSEVVERKVEDILPSVRHMIYAAPVRMIWMANLGYLYALSPSLAIGGNIEVPTTIDNYRVQSGFGGSLEGRFYPNARGLRGFYLASGINLHRFHTLDYVYDMPDPMNPSKPVNQQRRDTIVTPLSLMIMGGWVLNWGDLSIDIGLGFKAHLIDGATRQHTVVSWTGVQYLEERGVKTLGLDSFQGTVPVFRLNIGYSW
ncbi:MAG: hypothetical protein RML40_06775 [Bacteroidota bacterium]|nr:hypothetical protein [Candidatus Kapabacteria bacterium]MDW8220220.1 hypothetical protein [Bacteroidota bacterium]